MLGQIFQMMKEFVCQGLRQRHPDAGENELHRRLAGGILGEELAEQIYGASLVRESSNVDEHIRAVFSVAQ